MKSFGVDMIYTAVCTQLYIVHVESLGYFQRYIYIYRYSIVFPAVVFDAVSTTNFTPLSPSPQTPPHPHPSVAFSKKLNKKLHFAYKTYRAYRDMEPEHNRRLFDIFRNFSIDIVCHCLLLLHTDKK